MLVQAEGQPFEFERGMRELSGPELDLGFEGSEPGQAL